MNPVYLPKFYVGRLQNYYQAFVVSHSSTFGNSTGQEMPVADKCETLIS